MVKVRKGIVSVLLLLVILAMSACATESSDSADSEKLDNQVSSTREAPSVKEEPEEVLVEPAAPADLILHSSSGWTEETVNERFLDAVREKFPHHTISYIRSGADSNYSALVTAGTPIDFYFESIAQLSLGPIPVGLEQDMTALVKKYNMDLSVFEPSMLDVVRTMGDGRLIALPFLNNTLSLYYNKEIFDRFGITYPTDDMTWSELMEVVRSLTREEDGQKYYGLVISTGHMFRLNQASMPFVDLDSQEPTINQDRWKILLDQLFVPLYQIQQEGPPNFINDQTVAMQAGLANIHINNDLSSMDWDVAALPTFDDLPGIGPQLYPTYVGVSATSKHQDQGMEIVQYLTSEEFQTKVAKIGALPAIRTDQIMDVFGEDTDFQDKNIHSVFYDNHAPITVKTKYDTEMERIYVSHLNRLLAAEIDTNTMMRDAYEEAKLKLAELLEADQ